MRRSLMVLVVMVASLLSLMGASPAVAADSPVGTWAKKSEAGKPAMILTIEEWSPGKAKLTWRIGEAKTVLTLVSALDGSFAPLLSTASLRARRCRSRFSTSSTRSGRRR